MRIRRGPGRRRRLLRANASRLGRSPRSSHARFGAFKYVKSAYMIELMGPSAKRTLALYSSSLASRCGGSKRLDARRTIWSAIHGNQRLRSITVKPTRTAAMPPTRASSIWLMKRHLAEESTQDRCGHERGYEHAPQRHDEQSPLAAGERPQRGKPLRFGQHAHRTQRLGDLVHGTTSPRRCSDRSGITLRSRTI